jgi:hypothetical protein
VGEPAFLASFEKFPIPLADAAAQERIRKLAEELDAHRKREMARRFSRPRPADVGEILETLCAMGKARRGKADGTFLP